MPQRLRLIEPSVSLYRLLLSAYPAAFRNEYGESMTQLFRDTAIDGYRRRGLRGLLMVWLRTLADFAVSVIRQHRDKPAEASSESVLLRDFLQKWRRLGSEVLSVTAFSTWYGWHLLRLYFRRAIHVWATLTAIAFGIWFVSCFEPIRLMKGRATRVDIEGGLVQIEHRYDLGEPISYEQCLRDLYAWQERNPDLTERLVPSGPWEFSFLSDIPGERFLHVVKWRTIETQSARGRRHYVRTEPALIEPCKSWRLRFPFGILPVLLLLWTIRVYLRGSNGSVAAVQAM